MPDENYDLSYLERFKKEIDDLIELAEMTSCTLEEIPLLAPVIEWLAEVVQNVEECRQVFPKSDADGNEPILDAEDYESIALEAESFSEFLSENGDIEYEVDCNAEACEPILSALHDMIRIHLDPVRKKAWRFYHVLIRAQ